MTSTVNTVVNKVCGNMKKGPDVSERTVLRHGWRDPDTEHPILQEVAYGVTESSTIILTLIVEEY
jgi:hypothetical protein